jgi:hypothetical protein
MEIESLLNDVLSITIGLVQDKNHKKDGGLIDRIANETIQRTSCGLAFTYEDDPFPTDYRNRSNLGQWTEKGLVSNDSNWTRAGRGWRVGGGCAGGQTAPQLRARRRCRIRTRYPEGCSRERNIEGSCREGVVNISRCLVWC